MTHLPGNPMDDAFERARAQRNFLLLPSIKSLVPTDASALKPADALDAFHDLRWGWTDGKPDCHWCGSSRVYEFRNGVTYRCAKCRRQFSLTSGTAFNKRQLSFGKILHAVSLAVHRPSNTHRFGLNLGVEYKTAVSLASKLKLIRGNIVPKAKETMWPFLDHAPVSDADKMMMAVTRAVPKYLPNQVRGDVCQDLIVGLLAGDFLEADLKKQVDQYIKRHYKTVEFNTFRDVSFDQPVPGTDGLLWSEVLADQSYQESSE